MNHIHYYLTVYSYGICHRNGNHKNYIFISCTHLWTFFLRWWMEINFIILCLNFFRRRCRKLRTFCNNFWNWNFCSSNFDQKLIIIRISIKVKLRIISKTYLSNPSVERQRKIHLQKKKKIHENAQSKFFSFIYFKSASKIEWKFNHNKNEHRCYGWMSKAEESRMKWTTDHTFLQFFGDNFLVKMKQYCIENWIFYKFLWIYTFWYWTEFFEFDY